MTARDPLRDALDALPREIEPGRDLWPDIADRLQSETPSVVSWRQRLGLRNTTATAAVLVAASLAVLIVAGPDRRPGHGPAQTLDLTALDADYEQVRTDVLDVLDTRCGTLPSSACEGLRSGLDELDESAGDLREALAAAPADSPESRRLATSYQRTMKQARGLAGYASRL